MSQQRSIGEHLVPAAGAMQAELGRRPGPARTSTPSCCGSGTATRPATIGSTGGSSMPAIRRSESSTHASFAVDLRVVGEILEAAAAARRGSAAHGASTRCGPAVDELDRARPRRAGAAPSSRARGPCRPAGRAARRRRSRRAARDAVARRRRASRSRARARPLAEPARPSRRGYRPRACGAARGRSRSACSCRVALPVRAVLLCPLRDVLTRPR